jgi:hypothetical protein
MTPREEITVRHPLLVQVNDDLVLDAGTCEDLARDGEALGTPAVNTHTGRRPKNLKPA